MSDLTEGLRLPSWAPRVARLGAVALVAMLFAAGCGGDDDAADSTTTDAPDSTTTSESTTTTEAPTSTTAPAEPICEIVTADDVLAALQVEVEPGVESEQDGVPVCTYESADGSAEVVVSLHDPVGELLAETLASDANATEPPGVADGAVLQLEQGAITVRRGEKALVITATPDATEVALVQLARVGAGHL